MITCLYYVIIFLTEEIISLQIKVINNETELIIKISSKSFGTYENKFMFFSLTN